MTAGDPDARPDAAAVSVGLRRALVDAEPLTMPAMLVGAGTHAAPGTRAGAGVTAAGAAVTARRSGDLWSSTLARLSPGHTRGSPRATGTRGILVLAGLAASAVLAGTVAFATGPVAEITADAARPAAIVPGGATVGVPDPQALAMAPLPAAPDPSSSTESAPEPTETQDAAPVTARAPRTEQAPVRKAVAPETRKSSSHPTRTTHSESRTTTPADDSHDHADDQAGDHSDESSGRPKPQDPVSGVLHGVGGLVDGVLGGGH